MGTDPAQWFAATRPRRARGRCRLSPDTAAVACGIRLLHEQGVELNIIEGIDTDTTAMDHIIGRLQSGWTYIKVDSLSEI